MNDSREAYLDIVWRQFKKNRFATAALYVLVPMFLLAIFIPLIASDKPLVFFDADGIIFPWYHDLFNPGQVVDYLFNMALVGFVPWVLSAVGLNWWMKKSNMPGRTRLGAALGTYAIITLLLAAIFAVPWCRPSNTYAARSFLEEQFNSNGELYGYYVPIPLGPNEQNVPAVYQPPLTFKPKEQWKDDNDRFPHLLGTDDSGRDVMVRMLYGMRVALTVGFVAVGIYMVIGVIVGAIAGYFGGVVDIVLSRIIEVVMLFPSFFLILTLVALLGQSIYYIMLVIGLTRWTGIARLTRGEVLKQRSADYVAAARSLGASHFRIIFRHVLPNSLAPALVAAPFGVASAIIIEAGLSLLGLGVPVPAPTWGGLLQLGRQNYDYWWLIVVPSIAIFVVVTVFNLIGAGLRDAMDPRLRR